jgi:hypothetical protein
LSGDRVLPAPRFREFELGLTTRPYANHDRFGPEGVAAPCVVYVGGSVVREKYERRRATEPRTLVEPFAQALGPGPHGPVDLWVVPCPVDTGQDDEWMVGHYDDQLRPEVSLEPTALGCVGYSAGAHHALLLALIREAHALAVLGPAGLHRTVDAKRHLLNSLASKRTRPLQARGFNNDRDPAGAHTQWSRSLPPGIHVSWEQRPGTHRFPSYVDLHVLRELGVVAP